MFGQFNSELENKILVVLNEPTGKDTAPFYETIKNAISRKTNKIEHKGLKAYDNKNHILFCLLTNNEASIKISTSDRRFFATECNNTLCNNNEYFNALYAEIESGEYDRAFYDYFMSLDLENYNFTNERTITALYEIMQELIIPLIARFLEDLI